MKILVTESQYQRVVKGSPNVESLIVKYLDNYMKGMTYISPPKSRNYGNLRQDWCKNGVEVMGAYYYFEDGEFFNGFLSISEELVTDIMSLFNVRKSYVLHVISDWYEAKYSTEFGKKMGVPELGINDIDVSNNDAPCGKESSLPEGITKDEMIDFIFKNTLYRKEEITKQIESGERELEDFYLDIVDTVDRRQRRDI
jgi:hypothetical protein